MVYYIIINIWVHLACSMVMVSAVMFSLPILFVIVYLYLLHVCMSLPNTSLYSLSPFFSFLHLLFLHLFLWSFLSFHNCAKWVSGLAARESQEEPPNVQEGHYSWLPGNELFLRTSWHSREVGHFPHEKVQPKSSPTGHLIIRMKKPNNKLWHLVVSALQTWGGEGWVKLYRQEEEE